MSLKTQFDNLAHSFDSRRANEKLLLALVVIALLGWLYVVFLLEPQRAALQSALRQIDTTQARLEGLQLRERTAITAGNEDPNLAVRQRIERAIADQARMQTQIEALTGNLVTPQAMTRLLTSMLEDRSGLMLVRVENQPPQPMRSPAEMGGTTGIDPDSEVGSHGHQQVYKHSLRLELEGDYLSLINYLRRVETFNENFFWDELQFVQTSWPDARITLLLHTLSTEEGFVGV